MKQHNVHQHRPEQRQRQRNIPVDQKQQSAHQLQQKHHRQVVRQKQRTHVLPRKLTVGGGILMKWRNPFRPKTPNSSPSRTREIVAAIFIIVLLAQRSEGVAYAASARTCSNVGFKNVSRSTAPCMTCDAPPAVTNFTSAIPRKPSTARR
jgi:hypothetical protein